MDVGFGFIASNMFRTIYVYAFDCLRIVYVFDQSVKGDIIHHQV